MKKIALISGLAIMIVFLIYQEYKIATYKNKTSNSKVLSRSPANSLLPSNSNFAWESFIESRVLPLNQMDLSALLKQKATLASMTREQLLEGLKQLSQTNLDEKTKEEFSFAILTFLASLDPATTLKLAESLPNQGSSKVVNLKLRTYRFLTGENVTKATSWLDQQINNESLKARHISEHEAPRFKFEKVLISKLLVSNFAEAQARVGRLSDHERQNLFLSSRSSDLWLQGDRVPESFLELARSNFTTPNSDHIIGEVLGTQRVTSLAEATTLLNQSRLSDPERSVTAKELLLNHITRDHRPPDFETIYQWTLSEDEGQQGQMMTSVFNRLGPSEPSAFTLRTEELVNEVFSLADRTGDQNILDNYFAHRNGVIGEGLEREIDSFENQDLANRFRTALQQ